MQINILWTVLAAFLGFAVCAWLTAGKITDLQGQINAKTKNNPDCENCTFASKFEFYRKENAGMEEALKRERKSNRALEGVVNQQVYQIKEMKCELRRYKATERKLAFQDMARGLQP